ncbi:MAG: aminotransferase class III-fold pyridoxal phosphate-dependent enzyme [Syntrophomonadaceae bacterium]|nr:aminotransferase class III-fold pyridoxal phosphate-dependent enzyme [Syntrophomonadaceae bacterium]
MPFIRRELFNPTIVKILDIFKIDKEYVKGEGNYLVDAEGTRYLDFISQYGAIPFGYNPDFIWQALDQVREKGIPSLVQPSIPIEAVKLSNKLADCSPGDLCYATFAQSGTEAVEAAIKMARSATGRKIIISTERSFHGKTLGALSATGREVYQTPFDAPAPHFEYIPYNDAEALKAILAEKAEQVAAFIVEPVQGEGGIIPAKPGYLKQTQDLCREFGVVFIVDEIQTGLGRTGYLFACEEEGIEPDIMLLAKALGGGMLPIGVTLSSPRVFNDEFGSLHSSTFANNNLTCAVGSAVIDELLKDDRRVIKEVKVKGDYLLGKARELAKAFPEVIKDVRGKGLMVGMEFDDLDDCGSFDMIYLADRKGFTGLLAGYLLNCHQIRIAPFLNNPMTLRLQPTFTITYEEIDMVMEKIALICSIMKMKDYAQLYRFLIGDNRINFKIKDYRHKSRQIKSSCLEKEETAEEKFAFLIHYPAPEDVVANNPSFESFSRKELNQLMEWESKNDEPGIVCHMPAIRSKAGKVAEGWLVGVPYGARQMMNLPREEVVEVIKQAVDTGRDLGAKIVGLGALTSVVTRGGRSVQGRDVAITSGNSFTVLMAMEALYMGAQKMRKNLNQVQGAVVGATGSIGRTCALMLSEEVNQITLLGNSDHPVSSKNRLQSLAQEIIDLAVKHKAEGKLSGLSRWLVSVSDTLAGDESPQGSTYWQELNNDGLSFDKLQEICAYLKLEVPIVLSIDINKDLINCDLVVAASNSPEYLVYPQHLKAGAVVCDVARPADISPEVYATRNDVLILEGGLVQFPDEIRFGPNLGYRDGVNMACLSETILLALEGDYRDYSIGMKLPLETVDYLRALGKKHGFSLAGLMMGNREITDKDIDDIYYRSIDLKRVENV